SYIEALVALSNRATQKTDWKEVEEIGNQLKKYAPNAAEGYLARATARINQGDPLGAEADLTNLQRISPQGSLYFVKMGVLRLAQKRNAEAETFFRQALQRDPNSVEAVAGIVRTNLRTNKLSDAASFVQEQLKRSPDSVTLYLIQAEVQIQQKQNDIA